MKRYLGLFFCLGVSVLSLGCRDYEATMSFYDTPYCSMGGDKVKNPDTYKEFDYNIRPTSQINFIVRIFDQSGAPLANTPVVYSYEYEDRKINGSALVLFEEALLTDSNGYLVFKEEKEKEIIVNGWSSTKSNTSGESSTFGVGAVIGPLGVGASSTSGSSTTYEQTGFQVRVSSQVSPILMESGSYHGKILVFGKDLGKDAFYLTTKLEKTETTHKVIDPYLRSIHVAKIDNSGYCEEGTCENGWALKEQYSSLNRDSKSPDQYCTDFAVLLAKLNHSIHEGIDEDKNATVDWGVHGDCANLAKLINEKAVCDSNWVRTVWETFVVEK